MYQENFKKHWFAQLIHLVVGFLGGLLLVTRFWAAGWALLMMVLGRQTLEYAKRKDTPGIDLLYTNTGVVGGILVGLALAQGFFASKEERWSLTENKQDASEPTSGSAQSKHGRNTKGRSLLALSLVVLLSSILLAS